jgi:hypothetical protein
VRLPVIIAAFPTLSGVFPAASSESTFQPVAPGLTQ